MGGHVREAMSTLSISLAFLLMPWLSRSCGVADIAGPNENRPLDDASLEKVSISDPAVGTGMLESHKIDA